MKRPSARNGDKTKPAKKTQEETKKQRKTKKSARKEQKTRRRKKESQKDRKKLGKENKNSTGTARYASINAHLGIEQSRRDDLESLGYVLLYFLRGSLPWQGLKALTKKHKYEKISEKKISTSIEQLCKGYPAEFATFMHYCRSLHFEDKPDYTYLRRLFKDLLTKENQKYDAMFDWTMIKSKENERLQNNINNLNSVPLKDDDDKDKLTNDSSTKARTSEKAVDSKDDGNDESKRNSVKLVERKSAFRSNSNNNIPPLSGSNNTTNTNENKVSSSFIKLRRNNREKDEGSNGKPDSKTTGGMRGFLSKSRENTSRSNTSK